MFGSGKPHIVSDVMSHTVVSVGVAASFHDVVQLMAQWKVSALPVLAGEGRVVGVVSEADLLAKEEFRESGAAELERLGRLHDLARAGARTAGELMTEPAVTIRADTTLAEAARVMAVRRLKRLPVVDDTGMLVGIVSRGDLLKVFLRPDEEIAEEIRTEVVAYVFGDAEPVVSVHVADGVVTLSGRRGDTMLAPVAERLIRSVEGVVAVDWDPHYRPASAA